MKLLFVCTKNQVRSPLAAALCLELAADTGGAHDGGRPLGAEPAGRAPVEVRSAGIASTAPRRLTTRELAWADVVVVMEDTHLAFIRRHWPDHARKVRVLDVPDDYGSDEPGLRRLLAGKLRALLDELQRTPASGRS